MLEFSQEWLLKNKISIGRQQRTSYQFLTWFGRTQENLDNQVATPGAIEDNKDNEDNEVSGVGVRVVAPRHVVEAMTMVV